MKDKSTLFFDFLIFSNIFVALPVALLTWSSYLLFDAIGPNFTLVGFVYAATVCLYSTHRIFGLHSVDKSQCAPRHRWALEHTRIIQIIIILSGIAALVLFLLQSLELQLAIGLAALISGFYTVPFFQKAGKPFRLRDINGIKVFVISLTVAFVTAVLPYVDMQFIEAEDALILQFIERFLFILAITIPFDIRDYDFDKAFGVKTLPIIMGIQRSKFVILSAMVAFCILVWYHYSYTYIGDSRYFLPLCLSALLAGWASYFAEKDSGEYYYSYLIEGTMILQFSLVYLASSYLY